MLSFLRGFIKNDADTYQPTHADLSPLQVPLDRANTLELILNIVVHEKNWDLVPDDDIVQILHLTHKTKLIGYIDDVYVEVIEQNPRQSLVHAKSKSRVGIGDFGQNRKNILELFALVKKEIAAVGES